MNPRKTLPSLRALLFPPRCAACADLLHPCSTEEEALCPLCRASWEASLAEASGQAAEDAARGLIYLTFYRSGHTDGVPERLVYHLKHQGDPRSFAFVAGRLAPRILCGAEVLPTRAVADTARADARPLLFTYPPRRSSARRRDGFDQAKRLAKALAETCGGNFATLIRRPRRPAREQKRLDAAGRAENAHLAYALIPSAAESLQGRTVVICDDVCTTGSTLNRCAHLLVEAGAGLVILAVVARTTNEA